MNTFVQNVMAGGALLFTWGGILTLVLGMVAGFLVGVIPGFGGANGAAVLLPFSLTLRPEQALILIMSIYIGCAFSASVPAILLNVPGESASVITAIDGHPMARQGRANEAIGIARMASALGGVVGALFCLFLIGPLSTVALQMGPAELFLVVLLALILSSSVIGPSVRRGLMVGLLGMLVSAMATGPVSTEARLTLGVPELYDRIPLVPAIIGLFAFGEMFFLALRVEEQRRLASETRRGRRNAGVTERTGEDGHLTGSLRSVRSVLAGVGVTLRHPVILLQSAVIGIFFGVVPGIGSSVATPVAYSAAKRRSRSPELFGKGNPEGIIAADGSDSALAGGTLVPTLALGIPGNATTAVVLSALYLQGIQPGPNVLTEHAGEAYAVIIGLLVGCVLILPLGLILATPMTLVTRVRLELMIPAVLFLSAIGAYAVRNSLVDVGIAFVFGILAFVLRLTNYPVLPLLLGLILGPLAEGSFVRALLITQFSVNTFWNSTLSRILCAVTLVVVVSLVVGSVRRRRRRPRMD